MGNGITLALKPEVTPSPNQEPHFDALAGFPNGRKERGRLNVLIFTVNCLCAIIFLN